MATNDDVTVWSLACNCLLYEGDPGPEALNVGTDIEPKMVPRQEAWRDLYARLLAEQLEADERRVAEAESACQQELVDAQDPAYWTRVHEARVAAGNSNADEVLTERGQDEIREVWHCAIALCQLALSMIRGAGAAGDDAARQRLLAGLRHQNTTDILGVVPGIQQDSARDLLARLAELE